MIYECGFFHVNHTLSKHMQTPSFAPKLLLLFKATSRLEFLGYTGILKEAGKHTVTQASSRIPSEQKNLHF